MSYVNPLHQGRIILISHLRDAFANLYVHEAPTDSATLGLEGDGSRIIFQLDEVGGAHDRDLFNFPFYFTRTAIPGTKRTIICSASCMTKLR